MGERTVWAVVRGARPHRPLRDARLGKVLALLCVAAQALGLAHLAFSHHAICPVHGELIDVVSQASHGGADVTAQPGVTPGIHRSSDCAVDGVDDHCAMANLLHQQRQLGSAGFVASFAPPPVCPQVGELSCVRRALFRLAPKQSPPA